VKVGAEVSAGLGVPKPAPVGAVVEVGVEPKPPNGVVGVSAGLEAPKPDEGALPNVNEDEEAGGLDSSGLEAPNPLPLELAPLNEKGDDVVAVVSAGLEVPNPPVEVAPNENGEEVDGALDGAEDPKLNPPVVAGAGAAGLASSTLGAPKGDELEALVAPKLNGLLVDLVSSVLAPAPKRLEPGAVDAAPAPLAAPNGLVVAPVDPNENPPEDEPLLLLLLLPKSEEPLPNDNLGAVPFVSPTSLAGLSSIFISLSGGGVAARTGSGALGASVGLPKENGELVDAGAAAGAPKENPPERGLLAEEEVEEVLGAAVDVVAPNEKGLLVETVGLGAVEEVLPNEKGELEVGAVCDATGFAVDAAGAPNENGEGAGADEAAAESSAIGLALVSAASLSMDNGDGAAGVSLAGAGAAPKENGDGV
jgi:hypothetical protein